MNRFSTFVKFSCKELIKTLRIFVTDSSVTRFPLSVCMFTTVNSNSTNQSVKTQYLYLQTAFFAFLENERQKELF